MNLTPFVDTSSDSTPAPTTGIYQMRFVSVTPIYASSQTNRLNYMLLPGLPSTFPRDLSETVNQIDDLRTWTAGWNGYDAPTPNHSSIEQAQLWVMQLHTNIATAGEEWIRPHIIADGSGDVVFEWWKGTKKLTVYVTSDTVEYVKVFGPNIFSDMEDGEIQSSEEGISLWRWLVN